MVIKNKITTLGLASKVDTWIVETGANKSEVHRRINEQLESDGKKPISYLTVSKYVDQWQEQRMENVRGLVKYDQVPVEESARWVSEAVKAMIANSDYESEIAEVLMGNINVETGIVNVDRFLSVIVIAGMAKVLRNPDMVSMGDVMKAAQLLGETGGKSSNNQMPTFIHQAVKIFSNGRETVEAMDIVDAEFN